MQDNKIYDVLIIGGGPGGYTAALYCTRAGLSVAVIEKMSFGGQMALTETIDNYPGFENGIDGFALGEKMKACAERFGAETVMGEVEKADLQGKSKTLYVSGQSLTSRAVIVASGAEPRKLGLESEALFSGRGVSYCALCDGMFFKNKTVAVVGGGNSAVSDAKILSRLCKKVYLIHRRDTLRADKVYHSALNECENLEFLWNSTVEEIIGEQRVTALKVKNVISGKEDIVDADGLFVSIGRSPSTSFLKESGILLDKNGYITADESTRTNISGVFAVGDVRTKEVRQIVTACADGAVACHYAEEYLTLEEK